MAKKPKTTALVPPATRGGDATTLAIPTTVQVSVDEFEQLLGGRKALIEALSAGDSDPSVAGLLVLIGDPAYDQWSLARLCQQANLTPGQIFSAFDKAALVRAQILARLKATEHVPQVVAEIARTALPHKETCGSCNGVGKITAEPTKKQPNPQPETCRTCNGVGEVPVAADPDQQQVVLKVTGLLKDGGTTVAVQNNIRPTAVVPVGGGFLEQLQQAVSEAMYGRPGVVDAETTEEPPS